MHEEIVFKSCVHISEGILNGQKGEINKITMKTTHVQDHASNKIDAKHWNNSLNKSLMEFSLPHF